MSEIQTLFKTTPCEGPVECFLKEEFKKTKELITDPANRKLIIGITVGKVIAGVAAAHGIATHNHAEVAGAGVAEFVMSYWWIPPLIAMRNAFTKRAHAAAVQITAPVAKTVAKTAATISAAPTATVHHMRTRIHHARTRHTPSHQRAPSVPEPRLGVGHHAHYSRSLSS